MAVMGKVSSGILALSVGVYCLRQYTQGGVCRSPARIDGKVVIITGANTGIGKETAVDLARRGGMIYMACRSVDRGEAARHEVIKRSGTNSNQVKVLTLDLSSLQAVRDFVAEFKKREDKLDILVNNAGVAWIPERLTTVDGYEMMFAVNHLGHFLLTQLLMEHLLAAQPSRVVVVASNAHSRVAGLNWNDLMFENNYTFSNTVKVYGQSKLANILFTAELARRLKGTSVTAYSLHPGLVSTDIGRDALPIGFMRTLLLFLSWPFLKSAAQGAQTQICCAVDENLADESGKYYRDCGEALPSQAAQSLQEAEKLWQISVELAKLTPQEIHSQLMDRSS